MRKLTFHAQVERKDRIFAIIDHFNGDFGTPVAHMFSTTHNPTGEPRKYTLFSTGIVMVTDQADTCIITMFIGNMDYATLIYKTNYPYRAYLPNNLYKQIIQNKKLKIN